MGKEVIPCSSLELNSILREIKVGKLLSRIEHRHIIDYKNVSTTSERGAERESANNTRSS